jgi:hypothetical protein
MKIVGTMKTGRTLSSFEVADMMLLLKESLGVSKIEDSQFRASLSLRVMNATRAGGQSSLVEDTTSATAA